MAIIYSYPKANSVQGSDLVVITRFDEEQNNQARSMSADISSILDYVSANYVGSQNLSQVLTEGNQSLLDAKIGGIYLYDDSPVYNDYLSIRADKGRFNFYDNNDFNYGYITKDTIRLNSESVPYGLFIVKPTEMSANRTATFQDASGTIAYLSDIPAFPTTGNYGLYAGTQDGEDIRNNPSEITLIPNGVGSLSVPANGFSIGDSFRGILSGLLSSANNQVFKIKVYINNIEVLSSGEQTVSNITDDLFYLNLDFTVRSIGESGQIASVASFHYTKQSNGSIEGFSFSDIVEIDTTVQNTLNITFQWNNASASNAIQTKTFVLNKVY